MLVGYSSSSEDDVEAGSEAEATKTRRRSSQKSVNNEDESNVDVPAKKKAKLKDLALKTRLPVPGCLLEMFPDEDAPQTEDSSLHGGRIRSFKHERGNWATYVYFPYHPEEEFESLMEELLLLSQTRGLVLTLQEEFHLSLSQTVVLRHHWIQPFAQSLRKSLSHCKRFLCSAERLKVYCNAEKTRTFLGMEVSPGHAPLLDVIQAVDKTMTEFQLETFYKDPSFHVSLAWCVGDQMEKMKQILQELQKCHRCLCDGSLSAVPLVDATNLDLSDPPGWPRPPPPAWNPRCEHEQRRGGPISCLAPEIPFSKDRPAEVGVADPVDLTDPGWSRPPEAQLIMTRHTNICEISEEDRRRRSKCVKSFVDNREDGASSLILDCAEARCRTGNKTFRFPLEA